MRECYGNEEDEVPVQTIAFSKGYEDVLESSDEDERDAIADTGALAVIEVKFSTIENVFFSMTL